MRNTALVAQVILLTLLFHSTISSDADVPKTLNSLDIKCEEVKKTPCMTKAIRTDKFLRLIKRKIPRAYA